LETRFDSLGIDSQGTNVEVYYNLIFARLFMTLFLGYIWAVLENYSIILKGLSHEIEFKNFDKNLQNLA
jgi:hypothetical protein